MKVTRHEVLLRREPSAGTREQFTNADMLPIQLATVVRVPREDWETWAKPEEITVTIWPGDHLNDEIEITDGTGRVVDRRPSFTAQDDGRQPLF